MAKAVKYDKKDKKLLSVTFQLTTVAELNLFRSLMEGEQFMTSGCPDCGSKVPVKDKQLVKAAQIVVPDPLVKSSMFGFKVGNAQIVCPSCQRIIDVGTCELTPFVEIIAWLGKLHQTAAKKGAQ